MLTLRINNDKLNPSITTNNERGLYALSRRDVPSEIKIGKITGGPRDVIGSYCTRYNPCGYELLAFWPGEIYYSIETTVHQHELLRDHRIRCPHTNRLTEWFTIDIQNISHVVNALTQNKIISKPTVNNTITESSNNTLVNNTIAESSDESDSAALCSIFHRIIPELPDSIHQIIRETYDSETNILTIVIDNTPKGKHELMRYIDERVKEFSSMIIPFIRQLPLSFDISAFEFKRLYVDFSGNNVNKQEFGRLISEYINDANIKRVMRKTGTFYVREYIRHMTRNITRQESK